MVNLHITQKIKDTVSEKWDEVKRVSQHIPIGIAIVFMWLVAKELAILFGVGFYIYQVMQFIHYLKLGQPDRGWRDVSGALWGIGIGVIALFIIRMIL